MDSLNCIIIDDIKTDALSVLSLLKKHSNYNVLGVFNNQTNNQFYFDHLLIFELRK